MPNMTIAPPGNDKTALKVNVFERSRQINTSLATLFRYLDPGAIVPAVTLAIGGPGRRFQMFKHLNSVDEVAVIFAAAGVARGHSGQVFVGAREHYVNLGFNDATDPESFILIVVTQRQWEAGPQRQYEKLSIICEQCQEPLVERKFHSDCTEEEIEHLKALGAEMPFHTTIESGKIVETYNADPGLMTCAECGFVNRPFAVDEWGWHRYTEQTAAADKALAAYKATDKSH